MADQIHLPHLAPLHSHSHTPHPSPHSHSHFTPPSPRTSQLVRLQLCVNGRAHNITPHLTPRLYQVPEGDGLLFQHVLQLWESAQRVSLVSCSGTRQAHHLVAVVAESVQRLAVGLAEWTPL